MADRIDDRELLALIREEERQAIGYFADEIADAQAKNLDYYYSKPLGNEEPGRSQVVASDVADTVEGMLPFLLKPFVSSDEVVRFNAFGPEDVEAAEQESDYINWVVTQRNNSFLELYQWIKTGLLQNNGIVKYWWETSRKVEVERYQGVPEDVYALLKADKSIEIVEATAVEMEPLMPGMPPETGYDITLRSVYEQGQARYRCVPPEEFLVSRDAYNCTPQSAKFVEHRARVTISDLREMGYEIDDDLADEGGDDPWFSEQYIARRHEGEVDYSDGRKENREVIFREAYYHVDMDGDGIAELRKICFVGQTILANEETEDIPFCAWSPYAMPFKFYGRCPADMVADIHLIKTTLMRQMLDNIYTINNNRLVVSDRVNMDDLLANGIGQPIRVKAPQVANDVTPVAIQPLGNVILPTIEFLDTVKENRTGFTRYNSGLDANSLNKTATGVTAIMNAANARMDLIARIFAEVALKPLMLAIHGLCRRHATKAETIQLRGRWVPINPRTWRRRMDMTVSVGLGTGDKQQQLQAVMLWIQQLPGLIQLGLADKKAAYEAFRRLAEVNGWKDADRYLVDPALAPPPQPQGPPPEVIAQQAEMQAKAQDSQAAKQIELIKLKTDADLKAREIAIKERAQMLAERQAAIEMQNGHDKDAESQATKAQVQAIGEAVQQLSAIVQQILIKVNQPKQAVISYDEKGNPLAMQADGQTSRFVYDDAGRVIGVQPEQSQ